MFGYFDGMWGLERLQNTSRAVCLGCVVQSSDRQDVQRWIHDFEFNIVFAADLWSLDIVDYLASIGFKLYKQLLGRCRMADSKAPPTI